MGLDMYLEGELLAPPYREDGKELLNALQKTSLGAGLKEIGAEPMGLVLHLGYWRKANAIHGWFVTNVQDGLDDCRRHDPVTTEQLCELRDLCKEVLKIREQPQAKTVAMTKLPPQSGFFFGSPEIDEGYWEDLELTVEIIDRLRPEDPKSPLHRMDVYYRSSW